VLLDPTPLAISPLSGTQGGAAVAYNGVTNTVVWADATAGIQGTWVAPSGSILNPTPMTLSMSASNVEAPAVSSGSVGLVVWSDWRNQLLTASCTSFACNLDVYGNFVQAPPSYTLTVTKTTGSGCDRVQRGPPAARPAPRPTPVARWPPDRDAGRRLYVWRLERCWVLGDRHLR
jgi:hypothetical protein